MTQIPLFDEPDRMAHAIREVTEQGAIHIANVLPTQLLARLRRELVAGKFRAAEPIGRVRQEFEHYNLQPPVRAHHTTVWLGQRLAAAAQRCHPRLKDWSPNDIAVQRYRPGHHGIGVHRDFASDILLVAVFTITGEAEFITWFDADGSKPRSLWHARAGSLILLRGPGLTDAADDRPYHSIRPPRRDHRLSLAYRLNTKLPH